MSGFYNNSY